MGTKYNDKKTEQLGMNASTASGRLQKDILWRLLCETGRTNCCRCKLQMTRDTFSIEHLTPWLDSEDPVGLFFDQSNIDFSHLKCNVAAARKVNKSAIPFVERNRAQNKKYYHSFDKEERQRRRRARYLKHGT